MKRRAFLSLLGSTVCWPRGAWAQQTSPLPPRVDGADGAPAGAALYPDLLAPYGERRPPWRVAGADYRVGPPADLALKRSGNMRVRGNGQVIEGYDFTGATLFVTGKDCTVRNCSFRNDTSAGLIVAPSASGFTAQNCVFWGGDKNDRAAACNQQASNARYLYCHWWHQEADAVWLGKPGVAPGVENIEFLFCLWEGPQATGAQHWDTIQFEQSARNVRIGYCTFKPGDYVSTTGNSFLVLVGWSQGMSIENWRIDHNCFLNPASIVGHAHITYHVLCDQRQTSAKGGTLDRIELSDNFHDASGNAFRLPPYGGDCGPNSRRAGLRDLVSGRELR